MKHLLASLSLLLVLPLQAEPIWTDPAEAAKEDPDFLIQGEYHTEGAPFGVQVVALGDSNFEAYVLEGGLPGAGWEPGKSREQFKGGNAKGGIHFSKSDSEIDIWIRERSSKVAGTYHEMTLKTKDKKTFTLKRIQRKSPTLGAKPPKGAIVLFDGSTADGWERGVMEGGLLKANHSMSKEKFKSFRAHIEFRTPYKPKALGQKRGNSGIYHHGRWETQVLDSFGLEGKQNECGGIYSITKPKLNMCLPPLSWQTYDVDFTAAKFDAEGKRTAWPRISVMLNGVLVHDDVELNKDFTAAAPLKGAIKDEPGPMFLQDHKNPVFFRNIWVLPK